MLNGNSTTQSAIIRTAYNAIGAGAAAFLTTYAVSDDGKSAAIVGGITLLSALGFRGIEGRSDIKRDEAGKTLPGDVGQPNT